MSGILRTASHLILLTLGLVLALSLLLVFYISPRLDQWREPIQEMVQKHSGMPIEFGALALSWQGINPQLLLRDVRFRELELTEPKHNLPRASVEELRLFLQPTLTFWKDGLLSIAVKNAELPLLIDAEGDVWVGQHRLPMTDVTFSQLPEAEQTKSEAEEATFIAALSSYLTQDFTEQIKLLRQDELFKWISSASVENLQLTVRDASGISSEVLTSDEEHEQEVMSQRLASVFDFVLNFKKAHLSVDDQRIKSDVLLQADLLSEHDIVIDNLIDYSQFDEEENREVSGYLSLKSRELVPRQLFATALDRYSIDHVVIEQFNFDAKLENGYWENFKADLQLGDFSMPQAQAESLQLRLEGEVADALAVFVDHGHQHLPIRFQASLSNGWLHETNNFRHDFALAKVNLHGAYELDDAHLPVLSVQQLKVDDPNVQLSASGSWHAVADGGSGHVQLSGQIEHLVASYLPRFLPKVIDAQALDWLDGAFVEGTLHNGHFEIDGLADHYPYGRRPQSGFNTIVAEFQNFGLDFHHQAEHDKWPVLHMEQGTFRFINDQILIDANRGWMNNHAGEESIVYDNLHATISSLERDAQLQINAVAETSANKFLVLMKQTPLSALLNHALDESEASGELRANLEIAIPLDDMEASTIQGTLYAHDGEFKLNPVFPKATKINGSLSFNERYLSIDDVAAQLMGGPAQVSGDIGRAGHALNINGRLSGEGIYAYYPLKGLRQLKGLTPYQLKFTFLENHAFDAVLRSNLVGLSINYPELYTKSAQQQAPLRVQWQRRRAGGATQFLDSITANYDEGELQLSTEFSSGENQSLVFKRGAIAFREAPTVTENGLYFHGSLDRLEIEALTHWIDNFGFGESGGSDSIVNGFDLRAQELVIGGFKLPGVRLKSRLQNFRTIPLELSGPTIAGHLNLKESAISKNSFDVTADLSHLHWRVNQQTVSLYGDDGVQSSAREQVKSQAQRPWKINRLDLKVQDLRFYKYHFANVEGLGEAEDNQNWRLDKLSIQDESAHLYGAAYLRQRHEKLIADLKFNINSLDTGGLLSALALGDNLLTGHGDIQGSLQIHDVLNFERDDLELNILGVLRDGHINNVGTGATRVLALLSLQALSKLPEMNKIFSQQGQNAMNYSYLRFHLGIKDGLAWLPDFRLDSPLVGLAAQGQGNLSTEAIDLDVVAVPHLDMSGAAVLTGVLVNPAVGVAAFLSQWLLRSPLEQGLTQRFKVGGTLNAIEIDGVPVDMNKGSETGGGALNANTQESDSYIDSKQLIQSESTATPEKETDEPKRTVIELTEQIIELVPDDLQKTPVPILLEQGPIIDQEALIIKPIIIEPLN
ncbi:MAG: DUF3971 domain-containing protein [Alcaligenaceae bacterium]|nr:DUF3971 domain-containing protein [Alcaligenaceae bacterium]